MSLFDCAGCKSKDEIVAILKDQLSASQAREALLQSQNLALVDARAHAIVHRKPRPVETEPRTRPDKGIGPETYDDIRNFVVPERPLTREELEAAFRAPAGVVPDGIAFPARSQ